MAALCAGINASGDSRSVEFISTRNAATVYARMKVRQFALRPIRVACHLSPRFGRVPATAAFDIVSYLTPNFAVCNGKPPIFRLARASRGILGSR
jgi:hypothetical protein